MAESQDVSTSGDSIRRRFLEFYASRGHRVLPSSSLVPDDPTVLLTIAGMLQFKPIFLGQVPICGFQFLFQKSTEYSIYILLRHVCRCFQFL